MHSAGMLARKGHARRQLRIGGENFEDSRLIIRKNE